ncbi:MAG: tRNA lysidine(34) synthetase TilS [Candidatus Eiseniibacteriota bacterium]
MPKPRPVALYRIARDALRGPCAVPRGARILVACSGGPDSLALLHVLGELAKPLGFALTVAHFDHGTRGRAGQADARFVAREAEALGLAAIVERARSRAGDRARATKLSEDALRRLRHAFLTRAARRARADFVALAHTADDQAETVLLRIVRGTGLAGLAAMRPRRGRLLRPILSATREEVLEFLKERKLRPRTDSTNRDPAFRRNYIRAEILPRLAHLNPQIARSLAALAGRAAGILEWLEAQATEALKSAKERAPAGQIRLVARKLLRYHPIVREAVFAQAFRHLAGSDAGLTRRHLDALEALVRRGRGGASVDLPGPLTARLSRGRVCFVAAAARSAGRTRTRRGT